MPEQDADRVIRLQHNFEANRGIWDQSFREIAELVWPFMNVFQQDNYQMGQKRSQRLYESTAQLAKDRFAAALVGFMAPEADQWHTLTTSDDSLNNNDTVVQYLDEVTQALFRLRYDPKASFADRAFTAFQSLGVFGTGFGFVDARISPGPSGRPVFGLSYQAPALSNTWCAENADGFIDTVHHKPLMTVRNVAMKYGVNRLHPTMSAQLDKDPHRQHWIIHRMAPNPDYKPGAPGLKGMAYEAIHVDEHNRHVLARSGARTLRYSVARAPGAPGEVYGRGVGYVLLPEIKSINAMRQSILRAQHNSLTPSILLHSKKSAPLRLTPNAMNFGMLDEQGRALAAPFNTGADFRPAEAEMERIRSLINEGFHLTLLQILTDVNTQETATKTLERAKERALVLGPQVGRVQREFLGNQIESELELGAEFGVFPPMPEELQEALGEVEIKYQNDITRAQALGVIESYEEWKERRALDIQMSGGDASVLDVIDTTGLARFDARAAGIPERFIVSEEEVAEQREAEAAAAQQQQQMDQDQQQAGIDKEQAQAAQVAGQALGGGV